ncbi:hypothetical protein [Actinokineospora enzanensis]|uniref:hypothetical protein n=1 Tax=Actinokineospora enzanensis TaxID=155975 RepID=UPI00037AA685|nr:hypothetical protein [Actinokineospora enzanensis]
MTFTLDGIDGHEGRAIAVLHDGVEAPGPWQDYTLDRRTDHMPVAHHLIAGCSCDWRGTETFPTRAEALARQEWETDHAQPLLGLTVPAELAATIDVLARALHELRGTQPLVAVELAGRIHRLGGGHGPAAMTAARKAGSTWAEVGTAFGMSEQQVQSWYACERGLIQSA